MKDAKYNRNRTSGFTLAELLVVVAIIIILAGVSFVAVIRYQRSLRRLEMDQTAKEIFLAAQNRLSLEKSQGTMERLLQNSAGDVKNKLGTEVSEYRGAGTGGADTDSEGGSDTVSDTADLYCIRYTAKDSVSNANEDIRERLLPYGSIDDTVRIGGNYLIFYEPQSGCVRAVWYSDTYAFVEADYTGDLLNEASADASKRESFQGNNTDVDKRRCQVGFYGGERTKDDAGKETKLDSISLELKNEEVLYAVVQDPNLDYPDRKYGLKLWIEGVDSGAKASIDLTGNLTGDDRYGKDLTSNTYYWILDDITAQGLQFADLNSDIHLKWDGSSRLIPGENVRVYAAIYADGKTTPYQTTTIYQENSLFQDKKTRGVTIANARHLENLDYRASQFDPTKSELELQKVGNPDDPDDLRYQAEQVKDISWTTFRENTAKIHTSIGSGILEKTEEKITTYYWRKTGSFSQMNATTTGCFLPVEPQFALNYKGNGFFVENLTIQPNLASESAGLFGTVTQNLTVEKLKLFYPVVTSKVSTGGLIGCGAENTRILVKDVVVQYPDIHAEGPSQAVTTFPQINAGGMIGDFQGSQLTLDGCLVENQTVDRITDSQSGSDPSKTLPTGVDPEKLQVYAKGGSAGGLLGAMTNGTLQVYSSSASVYVNGFSYAGGLLGAILTSESVDIDSCYVGGHTATGEMLSSPLPAEDGFEGTQGRYNIVARNTAAGGLAAIVPTNATISHSYVTASVYTPSGSTNETNGYQNYTAFIRYTGDRWSPSDGKRASDCGYCYSVGLVNGIRVQMYSAELAATFQKPQKTNKAFPYDETLENTYPMPTVLDLVKADITANPTQKISLSRYATVHIGDWILPEEKKDSKFKVENGNRLTVRIDTGMTKITETLRYAMKVHGETSKNDVYFLLVVNPDDTSGNNAVTVTRRYSTYQDQTVAQLAKCVTKDGEKKLEVYLDDITRSGGNFRSIFANGDMLSPGEDITINVEQITESEVSTFDQVAFDESKEETTNSLFGYLKKSNDTTLEEDEAQHNNQKIRAITPYYSDAGNAGLGFVPDAESGKYYVQIDNARHLENLSYEIGYSWGGVCNNIVGAIQTDDIYWSGESDSFTLGFQQELGANLNVWAAGTQKTSNGNFSPLDQNTVITAYDGSEYKISGLSVSESFYAGLFGQFAKAIKFENMNIENGSFVSTGDKAGGLIAYAGNEVDITNVKFTGTTKIEAKEEAGGFIGSTYGSSIEITNSSIDEATIESSDSHAGGFVGSSKEIKLSGISANNLTVTANGNNYAGGLIGFASGMVAIGDDSTLKTVSVASTYGDAGGLIGKTQYGVVATIQNFKVTGDLTVAGYNTAGGFVGKANGGSLTIKNTELNKATVTSEKSNAAGLVAATDNTTVTIKSTMINDRLKVKGYYETGGFIGAMSGNLEIEASSVLDASIASTNSKAGGLVGKTGGSNVTVKRVKIIGENTEVRGYNTTGGLFGRLEAQKVTISNAAVSAFIYASQKDNDSANSNAGGLIGEMKITGSDSSVITQSYYGGRTVSGKYATIQLPYGGSGGNSYEANIVANQAAGGIIGWVENASSSLTISCCFNTGSVCSKSQQDGQSVGGFFGSIHQGTITMNNCYSMGKLTGGDRKAGLIGSTGRNKYYYNTTITCSEVYYLNAFNDSDQNQFCGKNFGNGRRTIQDASGNAIETNSAAVIISLTDKIEGATNGVDLSNITKAYDVTLNGYNYYCKNWMQESDGQIAYYGDWPKVYYDGSFVYFSGTRSSDKKTGEYSFVCYDGVSFQSKLTAVETFDLEASGFGIITKLNDRSLVESLYQFSGSLNGTYNAVQPEGSAAKPEYSIVHYFGEDYYLFRLTQPKYESSFRSTYIKKASDGSVYQVQQTTKGTVTFTKID